MWSGASLWLILHVCVWMSSDMDGVLNSRNYVYIFQTSAHLIHVCVASVLSGECARKVIVKALVFNTCMWKARPGNNHIFHDYMYSNPKRPKLRHHKLNIFLTKLSLVWVLPAWSMQPGGFKNLRTQWSWGFSTIGSKQHNLYWTIEFLCSRLHIYLSGRFNFL